LGTQRTQRNHKMINVLIFLLVIACFRIWYLQNKLMKTRVVLEWAKGAFRYRVEKKDGEVLFYLKDNDNVLPQIELANSITVECYSLMLQNRERYYAAVFQRNLWQTKYRQLVKEMSGFGTKIKKAN
jgi:hypothetical protein